MDDAFLRGFEYVADNAGVAEGTFVSQEWLDQTRSAIDKLSEDMIQDMYDEAELKHLAAKQLQGFIAEIWHNDTFNMDASLHDAEVLASRPDVNTFASADVELGQDQYTLKYYFNAEESARRQAETPWEAYNRLRSAYEKNGKGRNPGTFEEFLKERDIDESVGKMSKFFGMYKVIPSDQLEAAQKFLTEKKSTLENNLSPTPETAYQIARYKEVLETITDIVKDNKGNTSQKLTHADAIRLAQAANEGKLDKELLKECGLDVNALIRPEDIYKEAINAGISAAVLAAVISIAPIIINGISKMIAEGEVDADLLLEGGMRTISATGRAFICGGLTSGIVLASKTEKLGDFFKDIEPGAVASVVIAAVGTIDLAIKLAAGKINGLEMTKGVLRLYITTGVAYVGGSICAALLPEFAPAYLIGSIIGSIVGGFAYNGVDSLLMSLCVEDGFTFFGLVKQDYTLPDEALADLGLELFDFQKFKPVTFNYEKFQPVLFEPEQFNYPRIGMTVISRDLIEATTVGYVTG